MTARGINKSHISYLARWGCRRTLLLMCKCKWINLGHTVYIQTEKSWQGSCMRSFCWVGPHLTTEWKDRTTAHTHHKYSKLLRSINWNKKWLLKWSVHIKKMKLFRRLQYVWNKATEDLKIFTFHNQKTSPENKFHVNTFFTEIIIS